MIPALALSLALYLTAVFANRVWQSARHKTPVRLTSQAALTALAWGLFYYLACPTPPDDCYTQWSVRAKANPLTR